MSRPDDHGDAAFNSHLAQSVFPNSPIQMLNLNGSGGLLATIITIVQTLHLQCWPICCAVSDYAYAQPSCHNSPQARARGGNCGAG